MHTDQIFCKIRKEWVAAQPEERVRQHIIQYMIETLRFPAGGLAVEKELRQLPHMAPKKMENIPQRRADIIHFGKDIHPEYALYPLLLIECKAVPLNDNVVRQAVGYNHYVGAYYLAVANQTEIRTGWFSQKDGKYIFVPFLPTYKDLIDKIKDKKGQND